jgi:hypothetical protein
MSARDKYRKKAGEAVKAAEQMRDPIERTAMLRVAQDYLSLADHVGRRHEHGTVHRAASGDKDMQKDS